MSDTSPSDRTSSDPLTQTAGENGAATRRPLTPAAGRALAEAAARRAEQAVKEAEPPKEIAGRGGLEPTRYGDWEINGLTPDF